MRKILILGVVLALAGCQSIQNLQGVYQTITAATVPPQYANIAINSFDALKATAVNYGQYCIQNKFPAPICSASNRRTIVKFVRSGTAARNQLEANIATNQPVLSTTYNILVTAINALQTSPIQTVKGQ